MNARCKKRLFRSGLLFFCDDLAARILLHNMAVQAYNEDNPEGAWVLMHAETYLTDRKSYRLNPPQSMAVQELWERSIKERSAMIAPRAVKFDRICPHCGGEIIDDADFIAGDDDGDEVWFNYRCSNCRSTFQHLPVLPAGAAE